MALNLSHKRVLQNLQNDPYVKNFATTIQQLVGYAIVIEVDWVSAEATVDPDYVFMNDARNVKEWFFVNLEAGLELVCEDKLGKEAMQSKIQKIKIFNTDNPGLALKGNVLEFGCSLRGNGAPGADTIQDFLNSSL